MGHNYLRKREVPERLARDLRHGAEVQLDCFPIVVLFKGYVVLLNIHVTVALVEKSVT